MQWSVSIIVVYLLVVFVCVNCHSLYSCLATWMSVFGGLQCSTLRMVLTAIGGEMHQGLLYAIFSYNTAIF